MPRIESSIDLAHSPLAEDFADFVGAEPGAGLHTRWILPAGQGCSPGGPRFGTIKRVRQIIMADQGRRGRGSAETIIFSSRYRDMATPCFAGDYAVTRKQLTPELR